MEQFGLKKDLKWLKGKSEFKHAGSYSLESIECYGAFNFAVGPIAVSFVVVL